MLFKSTRSSAAPVSFKEAILHCLPRDGGLYVPADMVDLRQLFMYMDADTTYAELVETVTPPLFQNELNPLAAARVAASAFNFAPQLRKLDAQVSLLELHNGPTGVFKDFGIAFLAAAMEELLRDGGQATTLTATTGDTGASVARAFSGRRNIRSILLYPRGPIRGLDPASFVSKGGNILPIQVDGNFDDCQWLIREAFADREFAEKQGLTSANTLNVGRLLPQSFYFLYAFLQLKKSLSGDLVFSVPSGNFGNLIAGLYAWRFGLPVNGFIAAMNGNEAFGDFFRGRGFVPREPIPTISSSMDVGNPSNYERLAAFYGEMPAVMRTMVFPEAVDDAETLKAMDDAWKRYGVLLDPHSAVGFRAAERLLAGDMEDGHVVIISTGHPAKRAATVREATGQDAPLSDTLRELSREVKPMAMIERDLKALKKVIGRT